MTQEKDAGTSMRYYVEEAKSSGNPLIVFLHGQGEISTTRLDWVLRYGPLALLKAGKDIGFGACIVHPQLDRGTWNDVIKLHKFIWDLIEIHKCDPKRIHLMGVSLGGWGVWKYLASKYAHELASATLMSPGVGPGGTESVIAKNNVEMWVAHAKNDPVAGAKFINSYNAVKKINDFASKPLVRFTQYGLSGHSTSGAWGRFMEPENFYLWDWMKYQQCKD